MSYKSLTVFLDNGVNVARRIDFALTLAKQHDAHLTGLHMTYAPVVVNGPYTEIGPLLAEWEDTIKKKQEISKEMFTKAAQNAGVIFDWVAYRSSELPAVIAPARASDLVIMGQRDPNDDEGNLGGGFYEKCVLKVGRPVLFIPYSAKIPKAFDKLVIAWDGGREAARAMSDAMPFLEQAQQVRVLTVNTKLDQEKDSPDIDIAVYLAKHGINVEIEKNKKNALSPATRLLSRAVDLDADLLVMGAYGHSPMTEFFMGGVTRTVMRQMTVPVLMSH